MSALLRRRRRHLGLSTLAGALLLAAWWRLAPTLPDFPFLTGWTLLALLLLLAGYGLRKAVPMLPLGRVAAWAQLHYYAGALALLLFLLHLDFRLPDGALGVSLTLLFLATTLGGLGGLLLSRLAPRYLAVRAGEVNFEQIPELTTELRRQAEALVLAASQQARSNTLADFYRRRLLHFFAGPRNLWRHAINSQAPETTLRTELNDLRRYLNRDERAALAGLRDLVLAKNDLDYHFTVQWLLRRWTLLHLPLAPALLALVLLHLAVVYAFAGGA